MKSKILDVVGMVVLLLVLATVGGMETDMVAMVPGMVRIAVLLVLFFAVEKALA